MMKKLELPLYPRLETIFGYSGNAPKVAFDRDPESDLLMYNDGLQNGTASAWAYLIWAAHSPVQPLLSREVHTVLLLERRSQLYVASRAEALKLLEAWNSRLLEGDAGYAAEHKGEEGAAATCRKEAQQLLSDFLVGLGNTAGNRKLA